jgi:hypothetical protein
MQTPSYFQTLTRDSGTSYVTLTNDAPDWVRDAVMSAHDDEYPNDWRYATCRAIFDELANDPELDPYDLADQLTDTYNTDLARWISDDAGRSQYVDDAAREYGYKMDNGLWGMVRAGQFCAIVAIIETISNAITENGAY